MSKSLKNSLLLFLVAIVWGFAFVAQSDGMNYVKPLTFLSVRSFLGSIALIPVIIIKSKKSQNTQVDMTWKNKNLIIGGILCCLALGAATTFQQYGILYYKNHSINEGKAGFLTVLYIIFVPFISILLGKKLNLPVIIGCILSIIGLYFLCVVGNETPFNAGDILAIAGAVAYAFHIMIIDYFAPKVDGIKMSFIQFLGVGLLLCLPAIFIEKPQIQLLLNAWLPILYAGFISCGVGYTLQIVAQNGVNPTIASMIMGFESVFAVIGIAIFNPSHHMSASEIIGCVIVFISIIIAQIPTDAFKNAFNRIFKKNKDKN